MRTLFTLALILFFGGVMMGQTTLVEWTFPDESADVVADGGIATNVEREISSENTSDIDFKNGVTTKAAQVTDWEDGNDTKFWIVSFTTTGYSDIQFSSKQSSGGNDPGPRDFKVQYRLGESADWADVEGSNIQVYNDWESGVIDQLMLPEECNNAEAVSLRWIMASDTASGGGLVVSSGKSKIDDIIITGLESNGLDDALMSAMKVYPNPATEYVTISGIEEAGTVTFFSQSGHTVLQQKISSGSKRIGLSGMAAGVYFVVVESGSEVRRGKVIVGN